MSSATSTGCRRRPRAAFARCVARTADNDGLTLVVALNYGGRAEIVDAARALAETVADRRARRRRHRRGRARARASPPPGIPDPDLVIRTSGEMRVSNFLLWQIAYTELWVTATLWPDFDRDDLLRAVVDYQKRERRFGGR